MTTETAHWTYTITARHPHETEYIAVDVKGAPDVEITQPGTKRTHALKVERVTLTYTMLPFLWAVTATVSGMPRAAAWRERHHSFWHNPGIGHNMAEWPDWLRSLALRLHPDPDVAGPELQRLEALREAAVELTENPAGFVARLAAANDAAQPTTNGTRHDRHLASALDGQPAAGR